MKKFLTCASLALIASHVIASLGMPGSTLEVIKLRGYPYALLSGAVIAFGVLYTLPIVTQFLNKKFPWKSAPIRRIISQFLLGILLPSVIITLLITVYFHVMGIWILDTGWLRHCSALIVAMLFFINMLNEFIAEILAKHITSETVDSVAPLSLESNRIKGRPYTDAVFVSSGVGKNFIGFKGGIKYPYTKGTEHARTMLPEDTHVLAKRGMIIQVASIVSAKWFKGKRYRIQVCLEGYEDLEIVFSETQTGVHRELLSNFMGRVD